MMDRMRMFSVWPGTPGRRQQNPRMIMSIGTRDYPTIQAVTLVFAILVVLVNLATDIIYVFLDPRLRSEIR